MLKKQQALLSIKKEKGKSRIRRTAENIARLKDLEDEVKKDQFEG